MRGGEYSQKSVSYPALENDAVCDCLVVGGGLCGVLTSYLLSEAGLSVILVEAEEVMRGRSGRSTAKATVAQPYLYSNLYGHSSPRKARAVSAAMRDGMDLLYSLVGEYGCGERTDMYYYTKYGSTRLRREYRTMLECGIDCAFLESGQSDIPDEYSAAVRIFNQLGLDATALGERLCRAGRFRAYEHTIAENIGPRGCTANGYRIRSSQTVCATNYPPVREAENPLRYARKTSVVVRGKCSISDGKIAADTGERMYYCADCGYGIRFTRGHILVSGMAHRGAPEEGTVEKLTEIMYKACPDAVYDAHWTSNDTYTTDSLPCVGKTRSGVYFAGGFCGWGMVSSAAAALMLKENVCGRESWYDEAFSPQRSVFSGTVGEHITSAVSAEMKNFAKAPDRTADDLLPGEGGIVGESGRRVGAYRDERGELHTVEAKCPHLGCELEWNSAEKTWDCPCHGSRFTYDGEELSSPARHGLARHGLKKV